MSIGVSLSILNRSNHGRGVGISLVSDTENNNTDTDSTMVGRRGGGGGVDATATDGNTTDAEYDRRDIVGHIRRTPRGRCAIQHDYPTILYFLFLFRLAGVCDRIVMCVFLCDSICCIDWYVCLVG